MFEEAPPTFRLIMQTLEMTEQSNATAAYDELRSHRSSFPLCLPILRKISMTLFADPELPP